MKLKKMICIGAIIGLANASAAQAAENKPCITKNEAASLLTYFVPGALKAVGKKCSAQLPDDALLLQTDSAVFEKYADASENAWPAAKNAIAVIAGDKLPEGLDMNTARPLIDALIPAMLTDKLNTKDCATIDEVYGLLEPLPPANLANLAVKLVELGRKEDGKDPLNVCKVPSQ